MTTAEAEAEAAPDEPGAPGSRLARLRRSRRGARPDGASPVGEAPGGATAIGGATAVDGAAPGDDGVPVVAAPWATAPLPDDGPPLALRPPPTLAGLSHWKRVHADAAHWFDKVEIERGRAYNRPIGRLDRVRQAFGLAVLAALVVGEVARRLLDAVDISGWILELLVVIAVVEVTTLVYSPWFSAYRSLVYDRRWGQSTQSGSGVVLDEVKGSALNLALLAVLLVPLYAVIRTTDLWWLPGWALFSGFTVLLGLLYPVLVAPIFNRFEPLGDEVLRGRLLSLARRLDLDVSEILVTDASKRSVAGNAYVAGLGSTRRVVLFDTILDWPHDAIEQVVAHELGHWHHRHLRRKLPVLIALQLVTFLATWAVLRSDALLDLAGVEELGDPASLPLFLVVFPMSFLLTALVTSWLSRADERQADLFALGTLEDPPAFSDLFRRIAERNKADVDPSTWKRLNASHPPVAERLAMADRWDNARRAEHAGL